MGQTLEEIKKYLSDQVSMESGTQVAETAQALTSSTREKLGKIVYQVLMNRERNIWDAEKVNSLRHRKHDFELWWDVERGEIIVNGIPRQLRAQLQKLLSLILEHDGKILTNDKVGRHVWGDIDYDSSHPIDQLFSELYAATGQVIDRRCVRAEKGLERHAIDLKAQYCLIRLISE